MVSKNVIFGGAESAEISQNIAILLSVEDIRDILEGALCVISLTLSLSFCSRGFVSNVRYLVNPFSANIIICF